EAPLVDCLACGAAVAGHHVEVAGAVASLAGTAAVAALDFILEVRPLENEAGAVRPAAPTLAAGTLGAVLPALRWSRATAAGTGGGTSAAATAAAAVIAIGLARTAAATAAATPNLPARLEVQGYAGAHP